MIRPALSLALLAAPLAPAAADNGFDYSAATLRFQLETTQDNARNAEAELGLRLEEALGDRLSFTFEGHLAGRLWEQPGGAGRWRENTSEVETATLTWIGDGVDMVAGQQIVSLGRTDGLVLLDRLNGRDYCDLARLNVFDDKRPNGIIEARGYAGNWGFRALAAPLSGRSDFADPRSSCYDSFNDPAALSAVQDPGLNDPASDWAAAAEISLETDAVGLALTALSTREDSFTLATYPEFAKDRPRVFWFGGSGSASVLGAVLKAELAYSPARVFTLTQEETMARLMAGQTSDGTQERWNALGMLGLAFEIRDWSFDAQYVLDQVESGAALSRDETLRYATLNLRRGFLNDTLNFSLFGLYDFTYEDTALRPEISYQFNDRLTLDAGAVLYEDAGNRTGFFGSYDGGDLVFVGLSYQL
ncbi:MAG: hypothetical protein ACPGNV_06600 [Mangrovicoccus sp.]